MDNAKYDAVDGDLTLLLAVPAEGEARVLPVLSLIEIERRPNACPMLRLRRALLRHTTPVGRVGTGRLIDVLNRHLGRDASDTSSPYAFQVIYRVLYRAAHVPVLAYALTGCAYAGDRLVVEDRLTIGTSGGYVQDEVLFSVGRLAPLDHTAFPSE